MASAAASVYSKVLKEYKKEKARNLMIKLELHSEKLHILLRKSTEELNKRNKGTGKYYEAFGSRYYNDGTREALKVNILENQNDLVSSSFIDDNFEFLRAELGISNNDDREIIDLTLESISDDDDDESKVDTEEADNYHQKSIIYHMICNLSQHINSPSYDRGFRLTGIFFKDVVQNIDSPKSFIYETAVNPAEMLSAASLIVAIKSAPISFILVPTVKAVKYYEGVCSESAL